MSTQMQDLENKSKQVREKEMRSHRKLQNMALSNILKRPWREDREIVSAVFSKWVRVTMFNNNENVMKIQQNECSQVEKELENTCKNLERQRKELSVKSNDIEKMRIKLDEQIDL